MRLLLTNDDGIDTVFLHELAHALRGAGHELYVVAPRHEQSWTGASKSRSRPVHSTSADKGLGCPTWVVDGTPSDCVNIALAHLLPPSVRIEGVVSGINIGMNASLGFILASGTVAGAWEGVLHGLPAIAFSQDVTEEIYLRLKESGGPIGPELTTTLQVSAQHATRMTGRLLDHAAPHRFVVHNVNFPYPCRPDSVCHRTVPAQVFVPGLFSPANDKGTHNLIWREGKDVSPVEPLTDRAALVAKCISHTTLDYSKLGHP